MGSRALAISALSIPLVSGCAPGAGPPSPGSDAPAAAEGAAPGEGPAVPRGEPGQETFLTPNTQDSDGTPAYVHVDPEHTPLRIAIGYPPTAPEGASRDQAREAAIDEMRLWQRAIQPDLAWFRLEFVERDPQAAVQVIWKRRLTGDWGGWGGLRYEIVEGKLRIGGQMELSITPSPYVRLKLDDLRLIVAHEFGHVLGLGHCLECDSAMNYAFETTERAFVTPLDVRTFLALVRTRNGERVDGELLQALRPPAPVSRTAPE